MRRTSLVVLGPLVRLPAMVTFVAIAGSGCARGASAEERQLAQLREDIARVQADHDRFEQRLDRLEVDREEDRTAPTRPPARSGATPVATPHDLRVVHLGPGAADEPDAHAPGPPPASAAANVLPSDAGAPSADDPDDTTPRPSIRVQGTQVGARGARRARAQHVEETLPPEDGTGAAASTSADHPRVSALDADAKRAYDAALALVNARRYPEALDAFAAFLVRWPDHPNADNAMYWRGESYLAEGELGRAAEQFEGVVARFPLGNKVPDALLKLGICQLRLKNPAAARAQFDRLQREYPRSEAARRVPSLPESK